MFDALHHAALNTAIADRTRLTEALRGLLTAVQAEYPRVTLRLLQAEAVAVEALQSVGGPGVEAVAGPAVAAV